MKIEIDISDFYLDEDQDIEIGLKNYIKNQVVNEIWSKINKKVEEQITMQVKDTVEKEMYRQITTHIGNIIKTEKTKSLNKPNEMVTMEEYVIEHLTRNNWQGTFSDNMKKIADNLVADLKKRYDLLFASQIVGKMNESGLLKDDVIKLLMPSK